MSAAVLANPLVDLAQSRASGDRERLLAKLADLCEVRARPLPSPMAGEVEAVFIALVGESDLDVRARLAERIARSTWPPVTLVELLARDEIEVARPIIAASPRLDDALLLALATDAGPAHRIEIAYRPLITEAVAAALVASDEPASLAALAANATARIAPEEMRRLVERAGGAPALAAALASHPKLTPELAQRLHGRCDPKVRAMLAARFGALLAGSADAKPDCGIVGEAAMSGPSASDVRLVEKLAAAGQLRPGWLVRVLKEARLGLFEAGLAKLGDFRAQDIRRAVEEPERPELLALACAAVGLDRSVFPTVLDLVRSSTNGLPGGGEASARRAASAFGAFTPELAATTFRVALGGV